MDIPKLKKDVSDNNTSAQPSLKEYIKNKCITPAYDEDWNTTGDLQKGAELMKQYLEKMISDKKIKNVTTPEILKSDEKTPLLNFTVTPTTPTESYSILLYGHLDKIPATKGDTSAYEPVIKDDKLYGRGSANDGYAFYTILSAIQAIQAQEEQEEKMQQHPKIHVVIESSSESGSTDLLGYLKAKTEINPNLIICLDNEAPTYKSMWITSSMRGEISLDVNVHVALRGVHCGKFGGLIPDSFFVLKEILKKIEKIEDTQVTLPLLEVSLSPEIKDQLKKTADALGPYYYNTIPLASQEGKLLGKDTLECYTNNIYMPSLYVSGQEGIPDMEHAAGTLRPESTFRLTIKIPPTKDASEALEEIKNAITGNPPFNTPITISNTSIIQGGVFEIKKEINDALEKSSQDIFESPLVSNGVGHHIDSALILSACYEKIPIILTGAAGPSSNRYGAKENINIPYWNNLTAAIADFISQYETYKD